LRVLTAMGGADDPYARMARHYDRVLNPVLDPVRRRIACVLERLSCRRVLDVCCGTARQAVFLPHGVHDYTGVDISGAMLEQGMRALCKAGIRNGPCRGAAGKGEDRGAAVTLLRADGILQPFADNTFDAAVIAFALHEKPPAEAAAVLAESVRVARQLIVAEYTMPERVLEVPGALLMHLPERMAGRMHYRFFRSFMQAGGMQGLAHRQGLRELERHRLFCGGAAVTVYSA